MFSAYTIRKVLPKLVIAAIVIQLSWWICIAAITINNNIAHGIEGIMYAPFGGSGSMNLQGIFASNSKLSAGQFDVSLMFTSVAAGVGFFFAGASSMMGILALATTAALGVLIALFTLILRKIIIIALVLTAPIAIAAWILPGTDKLWKIWWESFTKLLLVYPLIMIMIAGGRIFAYIAASGDVNQFVTFALIIFGFFGPLLLIPATLKLAGTAFTALTGAVNNRSKGVFDGLRGYRKKEGQRIRAATKAGQRTKGSNAFTDRVNRIGGGAASGVSGGFGLGKRGKAYRDEFLMTNSDEMMKSQTWKGNMFKDDAMRALTYGNEAAAERALSERVRQGKMSEEAKEDALRAAKRIGYGSTSQVAAARQMAMNKTGFDDAQDAMETVQRVAGNNSGLQTSLKENVKYISKGVGRHDLGALDKRMAGETDDEWNDRMTVAGAQTADAMTLARDHNASMKNINKSVRRLKGETGDDLDRSAVKTSEEKAAEKAAAVQTDASRAAEGLASSVGYGTLGNQEEITELGEMETGGRVPNVDPSGSRTVTKETRPDGTEVLRDRPDLIEVDGDTTRAETVLDAARRKSGGVDPSRVADELGRGDPPATGPEDH